MNVFCRIIFGCDGKSPLMSGVLLHFSYICHWHFLPTFLGKQFLVRVGEKRNLQPATCIAKPVLSPMPYFTFQYPPLAGPMR